MARKKHIRMQILEIAVEGDKIIIAVKIMHGVYSWNKAYGMSQQSMMGFNLEEFKQRVRIDAQACIKQQELKDTAMRRIKDVIGPEIILD